MASANPQPQNDPLDEQTYLVNEFQRSKLLIQQHANRQHELGLEKLRLEAEILAAAERGEEHSELWTALSAARADIDSLAEEKLIIIRKLYNLSQRFVQELTESILETDKIIE